MSLIWILKPGKIISQVNSMKKGLLLIDIMIIGMAYEPQESAYCGYFHAKL